MVDDALRELAHTADIGFEAEAASLERLFRLAARGLVEALGASADREAAAVRDDLELERPDLERLLVAWLRELLHRSTAERLVPDVEEVRIHDGGEGDPGRLDARLAWRPWDDGPVREIKGVTYHELRVERSGDGWHARVVLDV